MALGAIVAFFALTVDVSAMAPTLVEVAWHTSRYPFQLVGSETLYEEYISHRTSVLRIRRHCGFYWGKTWLLEPIISFSLASANGTVRRW
jgi:hypothetical protein